MVAFYNQIASLLSLLCRFSSLQTGVKLSAPLTVEPITTASSKHMDIKPSDAVALAKKALSASKEAVSFADGSKSMGDDFDDSLSIGSVSYYLFAFYYHINLLCD